MQKVTASDKHAVVTPLPHLPKLSSLKLLTRNCLNIRNIVDNLDNGHFRE